MAVPCRLQELRADACSGLLLPSVLRSMIAAADAAMACQALLQAQKKFKPASMPVAQRKVGLV